MEFLIIFLIMILLILLGLDVASSMGVSVTTYVLVKFLLGQHIVPISIPQQMIQGVNSFTLLAVPLFILVGELMNRTGITGRLIKFCSTVVGHITGGLAHVNIFASMLMAGMCGSTIADVSSQGAILIPAMKEAGFGGGFSAAVTAVSATMGVIIPPSISFVILGSILNVSIGRLFVAGILPGILFGLSLVIPAYIISKKRGYPKNERASLKEVILSFKEVVFALGAPVIIMGSILLGFATPTEAGVLAVIYCMLIGIFIYKSIDFKDILRSLYRAARVSASVLILIAISGAFAWVASIEGFGSALTGVAFQLTTNVNLLVFLANILLLVMGLFMEPVSLMVIFAPVIIPFFQKLGVDVLQLIVMFTINAELGMLTPPVGLSLYIVSIVGNVKVEEVLKDLVPFFLVAVAVLFAVAYLPFLSTWLPSILY